MGEKRSCPGYGRSIGLPRVDREEGRRSRHGMDNEPEEGSWLVHDILEIKMQSIFDLNNSRKLNTIGE